LATDARACPVADFSALAQVGGLIAIDSIPGKCLASFARTAKLPGLRALGVLCDYKTTIDLQDLKAFQGLEAVALEVGCRTGTAGLAPLAALPRLRTLTVEDVPAAGVETLTGLTELGIAFPEGGAAPLAKLTALQSLYVYFGSAVDLSALGGLRRLEDLTINVPSGTPIDVKPLAELPALRRLIVNATSVNNLAALGGLPALCHLEAPAAQSGVDLAALTELHQLEVLRIDVTNAPSLAPLARLQALDSLELVSGCARPKIDLAPLAELPRLRQVVLNGKMKATNRARLGDKVWQPMMGPCGGGRR
jgi:hypothetical protein